MIARLLKRIALFLMVALAAHWFILWYLPIHAFMAARARGYSVLSQATESTECLEKAVGDRGCLFRIRDGSWIAIWYEDSHVWPFYSCSVALTSAGAWYTSDKHWCGGFAYRRRLWRQHPEEAQRLPPEPVEAAPSLGDAVRELEGLGFRRWK